MYSESFANTRLSIMTDEVFSRFSSFVQTELGIKMPIAKKTMLQARLSKRLRRLKINSFDEYYDYVFSKAGIANELANMIDVVTTNKTDFYREPKHFDYLVNSVLHNLKNINDAGAKRNLMVWSAGCSTGKEPYTLAMVLGEYAIYNPGYRYSILATDISQKALNDAKIGIYDEKDIEPVPMHIRKKFLLRGRDGRNGKVRIIRDLRSKVEFRRLNFMDDDYCLHRKMDIIFCRNVIIYFNRETQEKVLNRLCQYLNPGGYLFMGHSETLNGMNVPVSPVASTVYRKVNNE